MAIQTREVEYFDGKTRCLGLMAWDSSRFPPLPGVLVAHTWAGRDEFACGKAIALAEMGYVGFALDLYGEARVGSGPEENAQLMQPFLEDRGLLQRRMGRALETLKAQEWVDSEKTAAIGFCFGGLCVLDLARTGADLRGVVSFHGLLKPPENLRGREIRAKVLVLHGHDDPMVPVEDLLALEKELTEAGCDWQIHIYGSTVHAFTNPKANDPALGTVYRAEAARRAWRSMTAFFEEIF